MGTPSTTIQAPYTTERHSIPSPPSPTTQYIYKNKKKDPTTAPHQAPKLVGRNKKKFPQRAIHPGTLPGAIHIKQTPTLYQRSGNPQSTAYIAIQPFFFFFRKNAGIQYLGDETRVEYSSGFCFLPEGGGVLAS